MDSESRLVESGDENPQGLVETPRKCLYGPPNRFWFQTPDGWASREWCDGERAAYAREVLGQE